MDTIKNGKYIFELLKNEIADVCVLVDEPMKNHTSFRIGGNADVFVMPKSEEEIITVVSVLKNNDIPVTVIGNGSNLLVSDYGIEGAVICIGKDYSSVSHTDTQIKADAGILLSNLSRYAMENSLTGLEFASGIPGTLGGAIIMNAGAYDGEMKDVVTKTRYISEDGTIKTVCGDEHDFSYRKSVFKKDDIILSSTLDLKSGNYEEIKAKMQLFSQKRREKQPLEFASAGSTFKRPEGAFAAQLIDEAHLKGFSVGDACVSEKHAGFVINKGNATCDDVIKLTEKIKEIVKEKSGYDLELEVKIVGRR